MRPRPLAAAALLATYTYGTFLRLYAPGSGVDPGLFGYAPHLLLATLAGVLVAGGTDDRISNRRQDVRILWYPGWTMLVSLPLVAVVARGDPVTASVWTFQLVLGGGAGVVREVRRW